MFYKRCTSHFIRLNFGTSSKYSQLYLLGGIFKLRIIYNLPGGVLWTKSLVQFLKAPSKEFQLRFWVKIHEESNEFHL